ncbi:MAG: tail protein X [Faecalibacterium sp.]
MDSTTYTTRQGDMWDLIAYRVYGSEEYTGFLMQANFPLLDTFIFDAGVTVSTPALPVKAVETTAPDWRT